MWDSWLYQSARKVFRRQERAQRLLLQALGPVNKHVFEHVRRVAKATAVADPDMWSCAATVVKNVVDAVVDDVELEVVQGLRERCLAAEAEVEGQDPRLRRGGACGCCLRLRAWVLRHLLPCDRSIFGSVKDPLWWIFSLPAFLPCYNIRVVSCSVLLLMHLLPGPPDEYQLINYILHLKVSQFVSAGVGAMLLAAMKYFFCMSFAAKGHLVLKCVNEDGLLAFSLCFCVVDYLGSFLLTRFALCALPFARRHGLRFTAGDVSLPGAAPSAVLEGSAPLAAERGGLCGLCRRCCRPGGGGSATRTAKLVCYDTLCFAVSLLCLGVLMLFTFLDAEAEKKPEQVKANVYWCKVVYSLLAFPFLFLITPLATLPFSLVTRARPTGYNNAGACVAFKLRARLEAGGEGSDSDSDSASSSSDDSASLPDRPGPSEQESWRRSWGCSW